MDGSTASLIAIPIVVVLSLAAWLLVVAYAASHPQWKHGPAAAPAQEIPAEAEPRPIDGQLVRGHAGESASRLHGRRHGPHSRLQMTQP